MKRILLVTAVILVAASWSSAQTTYESKSLKLQKGGTVNVSAITTEWMPVLRSEEMPEPYSEAEALELAQVKKEIAKRFPPHKSHAAMQKTEQSVGPYLLRNFEGNIAGGSTPNDNYVAISNGDKLITVSNTTVYIYDIPTDSMLSSVGLATFFAPLAIIGPRSDPKVLYDPEADRFVLMCQVNSSAPSSKLTVAFSNTNDPMGAWSLYALSGNPLNDTTYSDYPAIAVTDSEFFITINQVYPGQPWQTGFSRTNIWQMNKAEGYNGKSTVSTRLWSNVRYNGNLVRYMCPVAGGSKPYGPNLYLLSNRNFAVQNDTVFLLNLTGLQSDINTVVTVQPLVTNLPYSAPPDARQGGGQSFATNDARILSAFYENGKIQYVHNALDTTTGAASVYHGIIDNVSTSPVATGIILGYGSPCLGYPNLAYTGKSVSDNTAIISFNFSDTSVFSSCGAVIYDGVSNYSANTNIKMGVNWVDVLLSSSERWGDYSGCQRKFNEPGKVWTAGSWGRSNKSHGTWVAELSLTPPNLVESPGTHQLQGMVFPNPLKDIASVKFYNPADQQLRFEIYSEEGRLISVMLDDQVNKGDNVFSFSMAPLPQGIYFLRINTKGNNETLFTQKVIKAGLTQK